MSRSFGAKKEDFFKPSDSTALSGSTGTGSSYLSRDYTQSNGYRNGSRDKVGEAGSLTSNGGHGDLKTSLGSSSSSGSALSSTRGSTSRSSTSRNAASTETGTTGVGYASLPNQIYRRAVRRGFEFNLMVVGASGLGKSTLVNSLFMGDFYTAEHQGPSKRIKKTVYVEPTTVVLRENGVLLKLTLVDTPGFGDAVDNSACWDPLIECINSRFDDYMSYECRLTRPAHIPDTRIHGCVYFIQPTGHGLKPLDIEFMRRIHEKVNVIPIIAKADTMTAEECRDFKRQILTDLAQHKIRIYDFPESVEEDDAAIAELRKIKERVPFALVGSNATVERSDGTKVRARAYPWGVVEVDNMEHNDFIPLRNLVLRSHMQDLKEVTSTVHYENYRFSKLSGIAQEGKFQTKDGRDPMMVMESEKKEHESKMKKMEAEMELVFEQKVKEKTQKLGESESDLQRRADQMRTQLDAQNAEMDEKRRAFEREKTAWEETNRDLIDRGLELRASAEKLDGKEKSKTKRKGLF